MSLHSDVAKLLGDPPYEESSNICKNDAYYARSLEKKWGKPIESLILIYKVFKDDHGKANHE